jgi:hypothetical protein
MTLVLETGVGVRGANAYATDAYVTNYLTQRNRQDENDWNRVSSVKRESSIISATDYIDKRFDSSFRGMPLVTFPEQLAMATITFTGQPVEGQTFLLGDETYKFVTSVTSPFDVIISALTSQTLSVIINRQSRHCTATISNNIVTLHGVMGTVISGTVSNVYITQFLNGFPGGLQPLSWPRAYAYDRYGVILSRVPECIKQAVAEYAVRALSEPLLKDHDSSLSLELVNIGPITEKFEYSNVSVSPYPAADKLLKSVLKGNGGVSRA